MNPWLESLRQNWKGQFLHPKNQEMKKRNEKKRIPLARNQTRLDDVFKKPRFKEPRLKEVKEPWFEEPLFREPWFKRDLILRNLHWKNLDFKENSILTDVLWYRPRGMGHSCWNFLTILMGSRGSLGAMKILGYSLVSGFWYLSYDPWKFLARVLRILRNWNFGGEGVIFWQSTSGSDGRTEDFRGGYVEKKIS